MGDWDGYEEDDQEEWQYELDLGICRRIRLVNGLREVADIEVETCNACALRDECQVKAK